MLVMMVLRLQSGGPSAAEGRVAAGVEEGEPKGRGGGGLKWITVLGEVQIDQPADGLGAHFRVHTVV